MKAGPDWIGMGPDLIQYRKHVIRSGLDRLSRKGMFFIHSSFYAVFTPQWAAIRPDILQRIGGFVGHYPSNFVGNSSSGPLLSTGLVLFIDWVHTTTVARGGEGIEL